MTLLNSLLNFKDRYELPCGFEVPLLKSHVQVGFPVGRVTLPPYEQLVPAVVALLSKVCAGLDEHTARGMESIRSKRWEPKRPILSQPLPQRVSGATS